MREGHVKSDRISVCILIDESGSMYGDGERAARDTAVLLNEAIGTLQNVDLYIYGHSTDGGTALYVYRELLYPPLLSLTISPLSICITLFFILSTMSFA